MKAPQKSLKDWSSQDWRTKSGKPSSETGERYLPERAIKALTSAEYAATTKANPRRASFLARMGGNPGPEYKDGEPTRLLLSLRAWGASSKAEAKEKARKISARNKARK